MIGIIMLVLAAKLYSRAVEAPGDDMRSLLLTRGESLESLGNKTLKMAGTILAMVWVIYGISLVLETAGFPELANSLDSWLVITAVIAAVV